MNVCYECYETAEELKYKMDCCLKNTRRSIFEKICLEKNMTSLPIICLFLSITLTPSNFQVFFKPQRISNHFGSENTNIKKVKIVPIKEWFSLSKPNKIIGDAKIQPNKYKKGINNIVDNIFGLKKNNFRYEFFIFFKMKFIPYS